MTYTSLSTLEIINVPPCDHVLSVSRYLSPNLLSIKNICLSEFKGHYQTTLSRFVNDASSLARQQVEFMSLIHFLDNDEFFRLIESYCQQFKDVERGLLHFLETDTVHFFTPLVQAEIATFVNQLLYTTSQYQSTSPVLMIDDMSLSEFIMIDHTQFDMFIFTEEGLNDHALAFAKRLQLSLILICQSDANHFAEDSSFTIHPDQKTLHVLHS